MNGICTIEMDGKKVKLYFGLIALERFAEKAKQYGLLTSKIYTTAAIAHILYAGYMNGCFVEDTSIDIPFSAFYEYVETASLNKNFEPIHAAMANFEVSKFVKGKSEKKEEDPAEEKKN